MANSKADGSVNFDTKIDTSGFEKGLKQIDKSSEKAAKNVEKDTEKSSKTQRKRLEMLRMTYRKALRNPPKNAVQYAGGRRQVGKDF